MSRVAEAITESNDFIVSKMQASLSKINNAATKQIKECVTREALDLTSPADIQKFIRYCYGVSTAYGEAAAAVACEAYDSAKIPPKGRVVLKGGHLGENTHIKIG